jgi:hypothetical protein
MNLECNTSIEYLILKKYGVNIFIINNHVGFKMIKNMLVLTTRKSQKLYLSTTG